MCVQKQQQQTARTRLKHKTPQHNHAGVHPACVSEMNTQSTHTHTMYTEHTHARTHTPWLFLSIWWEAAAAAAAAATATKCVHVCRVVLCVYCVPPLRVKQTH